MKVGLLGWVVVFVLAWGGCGDDDTPSPAVDGGPGADGGADGGTVDPLVAVPPERLAKTPAADCPASFATNAPVDGLNRNFESAGQNRQFQLILPTGFTGPRPLFVGFNGTGESGPSFSSRAQLSDFAARGFIVVAPSSNANGDIWPVWDSLRNAADEGDDNPDLTYFDDLVGCVAAHFDVDKHRIYVGGHSAGGIFSNRVLRSRSSVLAGGIVASGVFDQSGIDGRDLDSMVVLVTWGGENDMYSGAANPDISVPAINFVEQASIASRFYETEPNVAQANCHGDDVGHAWLDDINGYMIDVLLQNPKGLATDAGPTLPTPPAGTTSTCSTRAYEYVSPIVVECGTSTTADCQQFCQDTADCAVENGTVGPILAPQLTMLGFAGANNAECGGCLTECASNATTAADTAVLDCMTASPLMCAGGIDGVQPFIGSVNTCCMNRSDSGFCRNLCEILNTNAVAAGFFTSCPAVLGS